MGNQKNIIELNGKHYDALTGKMVGASVGFHSTKQKSRHTVSPEGKNMDGISRVRRSSPVLQHPAQVMHHKMEPSRTLMRKAVSKPHAIIKQTSHNAYTVRNTLLSLPSPISNTVPVRNDAVRLERAQQAPKSKLVSKFNDDQPKNPGRTSLFPVAVKPAPGVIDAKPSDDQLFQSAIDGATSHQQPKNKKSRFHHRVAKKLRVKTSFLNIAASSLAILLIGGFFAYQNVPNLAMKVASARAGVHASLPSYKPAGFTMNGPIAYKPGQITINFKSNSDNERRFAITQSVSSWNSETLLDNYVTANNQPYQTYENNGKTIYIYGGSNATWVDGGVWYIVQGNSSLNSDQLLRIANSI